MAVELRQQAVHTVTGGLAHENGGYSEAAADRFLDDLYTVDCAVAFRRQFAMVEGGAKGLHEVILAGWRQALDDCWWIRSFWGGGS